MPTLHPDQFDTFYHLTDKPKFKPNPKKVPRDNAIAIYPRERPGMYVAEDVEPWWNAHQYHRAYVAEIKVPKGVAQEERWSGEKFIPGEHLHQAEVSRVMPTDAWVREKYREPGWVESHHGTTFDTGEEIHGYSFGEGAPPPTKFPGYQYSGPDVRTFTPEQHQQHMKRVRAYRKRSQG